MRGTSPGFSLNLNYIPCTFLSLKQVCGFVIAETMQIGKKDLCNHEYMVSKTSQWHSSEKNTVLVSFDDWSYAYAFSFICTFSISHIPACTSVAK
jgi:hypothetical protein